MSSSFSSLQNLTPRDVLGFTLLLFLFLFLHTITEAIRVRNLQDELEECRINIRILHIAVDLLDTVLEEQTENYESRLDNLNRSFLNVQRRLDRCMEVQRLRGWGLVTGNYGASDMDGAVRGWSYGEGRTRFGYDDDDDDDFYQYSSGQYGHNASHVGHRFGSSTLPRRYDNYIVVYHDDYHNNDNQNTSTHPNQSRNRYQLRVHHRRHNEHPRRRFFESYYSSDTQNSSQENEAGSSNSNSNSNSTDEDLIEKWGGKTYPTVDGYESDDPQLWHPLFGDAPPSSSAPHSPVREDGEEDEDST